MRMSREAAPRLRRVMRRIIRMSCAVYRNLYSRAMRAATRWTAWFRERERVIVSAVIVGHAFCPSRAHTASEMQHVLHTLTSFAILGASDGAPGVDEDLQSDSHGRV